MAGTDSAVDVLIIGAGPAGLTAALRLQQLGYRVQVLERSTTWPRPQIGEALTPGVKNIITMLDANDAMQAVPHLAGLATRLCWRSRQPETIRHGDAAVVNRAAFDAALLALAQQRGIRLAMPAQVQDITGCAHDWQVSINTTTGMQQTHARFILDASGRRKNISLTTEHSAQQYACGPRLSAMWAELAPEHIPAELASLTQVEALEHGWLWGTRLPDQRYRIMLVSDPQTAHQHMPGQAEKWIRSHCAASQLFSAVAQAPFASRLQVCAASHYLSLDSWQEGRVKLGDTAFALDPISSSGVEKAMRFSLQAVVALHTMLSGNDSKRDELTQLARQFFEQRLIETCARHNYWTQSYYAQAWCNDRPFWQSRSGADYAASATTTLAGHPLVLSLHEQSRQLADYQPAQLKPLHAFNPYHALRIHPATRLVDTYCVVDDRVQKQAALKHPNLDRPISFLENQALLPHLDFLWQPQSLASVLKKLETTMGLQQSQNITAWLWQRDVLESLT
ncbi:flavin-dependent monooxygenase QhpG [Undibacterium sp. TJN19]|uniref:flavin-dependent monooxygenase QhpG n=1 Tax=Undibacterium sp. TJN19 TaxID=3413055 RepID=UPI003BF26B32